jgi:RNA polymerase sigma factor (TIGR02999 family)
MTTPDVTVLLDRARAGDGDAFRTLVSEIYGELRAIAHSQRRRLGASDTLNTTAVVHEAYAKLNGAPDREAFPDYADRGHFFRVASRAMRDIIVDYARAQRADKRGGDARAISLDAAGTLAERPGGMFDAAEALALDEALTHLEALDAESARIVELRYFVGLTIEEVAEVLDLSPATVKRRWTTARAWLFRRLSSEA